MTASAGDQKVNDQKKSGRQKNEGQNAEPQDHSKLVADRLRKLAAIKEEGINPYPYRFERTHKAQELQDKLIAAAKAGGINMLAADPATAQSSWWVTVSPFITKNDFQR